MGVIVDMSKNSLRGHATTYANWSNLTYLKLSLPQNSNVESLMPRKHRHRDKTRIYWRAINR